MAQGLFETTLYRYLTGFFEKYQFQLLPDKKQFRKTTPAGFQNVILSATLYEDETWLDVNFGCRHQQIEQIAQQFLNNLPGYRSDANTLIISIGKYNEVKYFRYHLQSSEDLAHVCMDIKQFFTQTGFAFMDAAGGLPVLDHLLNHHPEQPCKYVYNQNHRCFKGLIASRLNNRPVFGSLLDTYRQCLKNNGASQLELVNFERLAEYLVYYSKN